jgi:hypothetical protein
MSYTPMTSDQVAALLVVAMAYDNRKPGDATVAAWTEAALRGKWRFGPAREAIHAHYATSTAFIMPAHITERLKVESRFPPRFGEEPFGELEEARPDPAGKERVRAIVSELSARLGWTRKPSLEDPALAVECPHCHATPLRPCARLATRGPHRGEYVQLSKPHPSRVELAEKFREAS